MGGYFILIEEIGLPQPPRVQGVELLCGCPVARMLQRQGAKVPRWNEGRFPWTQQDKR